MTLWRRSGEFPGNKQETFQEILGNNLSDSLFALFILIYWSIYRELRLTLDSRASRPYSSNRKITSCELKMLNPARAEQMQQTNSSIKRVQRTEKQISILIGFVTFAERVLNLSSLAAFAQLAQGLASTTHKKRFVQTAIAIWTPIGSPGALCFPRGSGETHPNVRCCHTTHVPQTLEAPEAPIFT